MTVAVRIVPCNRIDIMMVSGGLRTGTARIFPLGFGWQVVVPLTFLLVEFAQKCLHVVPRNIFYRMIKAVLTCTWIATHHCCPLPLRDQVPLQIKRLTDGDTV